MPTRPCASAGAVPAFPVPRGPAAAAPLAPSAPGTTDCSYGLKRYFTRPPPACALAALAATPGYAATSQPQKPAPLKDPVSLPPPRGASRLFVVERRGVVRTVRHGRTSRRSFLDIRRRVLIRSNDETTDQRGLL